MTPFDPEFRGWFRVHCSIDGWGYQLRMNEDSALNIFDSARIISMAFRGPGPISPLSKSLSRSDNSIGCRSLLNTLFVSGAPFGIILSV